MKDGKTFSLADVAALSVDPIWIQGTVCIAGLGSIVVILLYLQRVFQEKQQVSRIVARAIPTSLKDLNVSLAAWMKKRQVTVASSIEISSPCIIGKTILFPERLLRDLSDKEIEAIIAHEMAHLRWRDCGIRIICSLTASLFWWIPTKWWRKRIEEMQEQASDAIIHQFGIPGTVLAEAILKTAQRVRADQSQLVFSFVGGKSLFKNRIEMVLRQPPSKFLRWKIVQYGLLFSALATVLFGTLWIF
ncbi:MAG TPA: M56 family metallopeptidase [Chlamydiales bacterium]|nr:M56 family metallopeptidase [Chlamydiales bacterium]